MSTKVLLTSILAIGPHPDDVEIGCGGLIQKQTFKHIALVTLGEESGDGHMREKESAEGAKVLGATWTYLGLRDTKVTVTDLIYQIEWEIRERHPNIICIPALHDTHQDHVATHEAALIATRNFHGTVLAYMTPSSAAKFTPNWFVELTPEQLEKKAQALECHASQKCKLYGTKEYINSVARYWAIASRSNAPFVEPYELIRHWVR